MKKMAGWQQRCGRPVWCYAQPPGSLINWATIHMHIAYAPTHTHTHTNTNTSELIQRDTDRQTSTEIESSSIFFKAMLMFHCSVTPIRDHRECQNAICGELSTL